MATSKSTHIEEKPKFLDRLCTCSQETRLLFNELKVRSIRECRCNDYGYTDKPDFRLFNQGVDICELVPGPSRQKTSVAVMLRVDSDSVYKSKTLWSLDISPVNQDKPGSSWVKVII